MIRVLIISLLLAFAGCNRAPKFQGPPPKCNDDRPALLDVSSSDYKILLCGTPLPTSHAMTDGSVLVSDFFLFQVNAKGERSFVANFSEKDEVLKANKDGERLRLVRMVNFGDTENEAYERFFVGCDKSGCQRTPSECILTKKKEGFPLALKTIEPNLKGHDFSFVKPHLLNQVAYEAYFGSQDASNFMANAHKKLPESSAWKPAFSSAQFFMQKLAELGCK